MNGKLLVSALALALATAPALPALAAARHSQRHVHGDAQRYPGLAAQSPYLGERIEFRCERRAIDDRGRFAPSLVEPTIVYCQALAGSPCVFLSGYHRRLPFSRRGHHT